MNKKTNKKGFTLIELLAVIVVLALILILAVPSILNSMNNAKKKTFQMYGERLVNNAIQTYESMKLLGETPSKTYIPEGQTTGNPCLTIADLGLEHQGSFQGFVEVLPSNAVNGTKYRVYLTDNTYAFNGIESNNVVGTAESVSSDQTIVTTVQGIATKCS